MANRLVVNSLSELRAHLSSEAAKKFVYILFTGDKSESDGKSWCPDCNDADPVITKCLDSLNPDNSELVVCNVGERPAWKDMNNEFRTDKEFAVKKIPTLALWKSNKSLLEEQCVDESLVRMLFEESQ